MEHMLTRPGFTIAMEPDRKLLRIAIRGFWDEATVISYDREVRVASLKLMAAAACARDDLLALVDARHASAQSQALLATFKRRFDPANRQPGRIATIVSSMLLKRQVERIAMPNQRVFEDERAAMDWLLG